MADHAAPAVLALRHEVARKALHLTSVAAPVMYASGVPRSTLLALLSAAGAVAVAVELARRHAPLARRLFHRATGPLLRSHEHERLSGATWLIGAFLGVVALAPREAAIAAMWAVSVGDASAAVVGRTLSSAREARLAALGGPAPRRARKSIAGSAACAIATFAGAFWLAGAGPATSAAAGVVAALAEWPRGPLDDNVRVAAAVAGVVALAGALLAR